VLSGYLGYRISKEGIQPTNRGIMAVQNFPEPKTVKEVQSFVGLVGVMSFILSEIH